MNKKGITLIALVVTIIVLLILVGVTISVVLGPDGLIEKSKSAKIDNRYAHIMDKVKIRESALEISFEKGEDGESADEFIANLQADNLYIPGEGKGEDKYEGNQLKIGKIDENNYTYLINIVDGSMEGRLIWQRIQNLPTVEEHPEMAPMTLKIRTTTSPETVTIPISNGEGLIIDWGDGQPNTYISNDPSHSYQTAGDYTLKIMGKATNNNSSIGNINWITNNNIVGIQYWGENEFKRINSLGKKLEGGIPIPSRNSFVNVVSFNFTFSNCTSLTEIPENLFINCPNVINFYTTFWGCNSLTKIPSGLFSNCSNVTSFYAIFNNCTSLTKIPPGLFSNCPNVTNFSYIFCGCSNLTEIPSGLFSNCQEVITFENVFFDCSNLTEIPSGLFSNCSKAKNFKQIFSNCSNLTEIPSNLFLNCQSAENFFNSFYGCIKLTTIPSGLFSDCPNAINFMQTFFNCTGLNSNIPATLFSNCLSVTNFSATFYNCHNLTGPAPNLWDTHTNVTNSSLCFRDCNKLSNYYTTIPSTWK